MESIIAISRPYIELIYFISSSSLAFLAYKALDQIKVAKNATQVQSKRESIKLAAERCEYFHKEVQPEVIRFFDNLKSKDIKFLDECEVVVDAETIKFKPSKDKEDLKKLIEEMDSFEPLFNKLEIFSMYFTGKIASEDFAYHALGTSYCKLVERLIPLLMMNFFKEECKHIMALFSIWNPRIQKLKDSKRKEELQKELSELTEKNIPDKKINPIGT